ncbi:hypothetical protein [Sanyastnella coralliicola]|uniref:hypothetical protein n=1 Tax=Sanyastnella coralliicola TaxID=3069118 RepID=UPI0027BA6306|nr:hypothetical protein [Longitalea sp. SCSIO 12813]
MNLKHTYKDLLASTAVFAEMANEQVDLKKILTEFVLATYSLEKCFAQSTVEVTQSLKKHFEFEIPVAVVRTILKKLKKSETLSQEEGKYVITSEERSKWIDFSTKVDTKEAQQKAISDQLIGFIELKKGPISSEEKAAVLDCFSSYLFDESFEDNYSDLVSLFIIKNSKNKEFAAELNLIREGITILKGIKYNPEINEIKPWRKPLTIHLDTEHLFNVCGLNGLVFQKHMTDLLDIVKQINTDRQKKNEGKAIIFKYLESTETEIKNFFFAARKIAAGESSRGHSSVAMDAILKGATQASDIIRKEAEFFRKLVGLGIIKQAPIELYVDHSFNIEDQRIFYKYENEAEEEEISSILQSFTAINILRKGNNRASFEDIGHIIMTGRRIKLQISGDLDTKVRDGDFSFATHIYYVTQRLWFRLNRGLGFRGALPTSLDVIAKAQVLLSNHLNSSVRDRFLKIEKDVESGQRSLESVQAYYVNLRSNVVKPEDLAPENVEDRVKFLFEESDIEQFEDEQAILRKKAEAFDQIQKDKHASEEKKKKAERLNKIQRCQELERLGYRNGGIFKKLFFVVITIAVLALTCLVFSLIEKSDTPMTIGSVILGLISVFAIVKWKVVILWLEKKALRKFLDYRTKHKISDEEMQ